MTDMVMPGMTGRDLIKDLKKDKEELKVIYTKRI
jgi:YesN/AraC family two-component response regulator